MVWFKLECKCVLLELESTGRHYFPFSVDMGVLYTVFVFLGSDPFSLSESLVSSMVLLASFVLVTELS